ncbi:MAG TPA: DUF2147 domain-containing protein [Hyphomicrobiaceae bacterium]|jgi:uncharacterized protein (DUF2147 family)|nr:DUF2147 domain-containing protein [Hyphomicrobiaceae bacterium]
MYLTDVVRYLILAGCAITVASVFAGGAAAQVAANPANVNPATDVSGIWIDHTGQGAVEIAPCGGPGGNRICGRVVWLKNPEHKSVSGKRICGTQVLGDLRKDAANTWESGWIYNPEDEERFSASLQLANADTLMVTGYLGIKLLGETFTWKRATTALQSCVMGTAQR